MASPTTEQMAILIAQCETTVCLEHEAWRTFEHEAREGEGWDDWVNRKARVKAKRIWDYCDKALGK